MWTKISGRYVSLCLSFKIDWNLFWCSLTGFRNQFSHILIVFHVTLLFQIRPCFLYKEEYSDCKSIKGRFHQYFIHGESIDCLQWKRDYDNCTRYEENNDLKAAQEVIQSESDRRKDRFKGTVQKEAFCFTVNSLCPMNHKTNQFVAHFNNDIWTKRKSPPEDWDKALPEWLQKRNQNTLLDVKSRQAKGEDIELIGERFLCTIM